MEYLGHYSSPVGDITVASDGCSLTGLWFDGQKYFCDTLDAEHAAADLPVFAETYRWLDVYFGGGVPDFTPPLRIKATTFRQDVCRVMLKIPFGQTVSYMQIAQEIARERGLGSMSAQAVGGAVAHNAISLIVPCHRVVASDGRLTGYAGGVDRKKWLLDMEKENSRRQQY